VAAAEGKKQKVLYFTRSVGFEHSVVHREDVWTHAIFQQILLGGMAWALGNVEADIAPNINQATPRAGQLPE
jgi:hypothetical protein